MKLDGELWAGRGCVFRVVANVEESMNVAGSYLTRLEDTAIAHRWRVTSFSAPGKGYIVSLAKTAAVSNGATPSRSRTGWTPPPGRPPTAPPPPLPRFTRRHAPRTRTTTTRRSTTRTTTRKTTTRTSNSQNRTTHSPLPLFLFRTLKS